MLHNSIHLRVCICSYALALALSACTSDSGQIESALEEDAGDQQAPEPNDSKFDGGPGVLGLRDGGRVPREDGSAAHPGDAGEDGGDAAADAGDAPPDSGPPDSGEDECDDSDPCTSDSRGRDGECDFDPVVCEAQDDCHEAGSCDPLTGVCSHPEKTDGSGCDDDDACTRTDQCQSGECVGTNPVVCTASDPCHTVGACDPSTGACSHPAKPNGDACNDGDECTFDDACSSGHCVGAPGVTSCDGSTCYPAWWLNDDVCDAALLCAETDYDAGDCACDGDSTNIIGCDGSTCYPATWLDDDDCDIALACDEVNNDIDDCACGGDRGAIAGCTSGCYPQWWLGDGECDSALNCSATSYDRGDCP